MDFNILDYGARANSGELSTAAIQSAIEACAAAGGGRVVIPAGKFLSGSLWLRSHVELHLERGAVLKASENIDDYNADDAYPQNFGCPESEKWRAKHLLMAIECEDVGLTGDGTLDGSADAYRGEPIPWSAFCWKDGLALAKDPEILRPGQLVCFIECRQVRVENVTLVNMPCWGCFLHGCDVVQVRGLKVFNPTFNANSDGLDIDSCSHVTVSDCIIDTGDDAIAIRGSNARLKNNTKPCEFVTISNCVLGSASSVFRIGVGVGLIRHVRVSNITVVRGATLMNFNTDFGGNGGVDMEDIHFSGISAAECGNVVNVMEFNGAYVRDVSVENVRARAYASLNVCPTHETSVRDFTLRNVHIELMHGPEPLSEEDARNRGEAMLQFENVRGLTLEDVRVEGEGEVVDLWSQGMRVRNCPGLRVNDVVLPK